MHHYVIFIFISVSIYCDHTIKYTIHINIYNYTQSMSFFYNNLLITCQKHICIYIHVHALLWHVHSHFISYIFSHITYSDHIRTSNTFHIHYLSLHCFHTYNLSFALYLVIHIYIHDVLKVYTTYTCYSCHHILYSFSQTPMHL